jgi:hypothetical protein
MPIEWPSEEGIVSIQGGTIEDGATWVPGGDYVIRVVVGDTATTKGGWLKAWFNNPVGFAALTKRDLILWKKADADLLNYSNWADGRGSYHGIDIAFFTPQHLDSDGKITIPNGTTVGSIVTDPVDEWQWWMLDWTCRVSPTCPPGEYVLVFWIFNLNPDTHNISSLNKVKQYTITIASDTVPELIAPIGNLAISTQADTPLTLEWSWADATDPDSFNIYIGTTAETLALHGTVEGTEREYVPAGLAEDSNYYWRVDAVTGETVIASDVENFRYMQPPAKAGTPYPANGYMYMQPSADLTFKDPDFDTYHRVPYNVDNPVAFEEWFDVYLGTSAGSLSKVASITPDASGNAIWNPSDDLVNLNRGTVYYWKIVSRNEADTTDGDVWWFKTVDAVIVYPPPIVTPRDEPPDGPYDPFTGEWDDTALESTGGGRLKNNLIIIGHRKIYVTD